MTWAIGSEDPPLSVLGIGRQGFTFYDPAITAIHLAWYHNGVNTHVFQELAGNMDFAYQGKINAIVHAPNWRLGYDDEDIAHTPMMHRFKLPF